jgi:hypothetical protein
MIYTSHYSCEQIGTSISISLPTPEGCEFSPLLLFAPSEDLTRFWQSSNQDEIAQQKYSEKFREEMITKDQIINIWINKIKNDITLNCYQKPEDACRVQIIEEIIKSKKPELWGGTVSDPITKPTTPSRPTKSIREMTWGELFGNEYTAVFEDKPPLPPVAVLKPWKVNVGQYAFYEGDLVKIVGGDRKGEWQLERPPAVNPSHTLPVSKQWVKTSALAQPPKGHDTWTDKDFKKVRTA